jgi:Reverse transcriptase (RNA-dependent DNA polymerase)
MSFIRKAFKKRDKKEVVEQIRKKLMTTNWILKEKNNPDNTIKYKARCVSRGFMQTPGVDYGVICTSGIQIVGSGLQFEYFCIISICFQEMNGY